MNKYFFLCFFSLLSTASVGQDIFDIGSIQTVKLYIDVPNWQNRLNAYKKQGLNKRLPAQLIFNGVTYDSVGIRYKGNSSFFNTKKQDSSKLPFNIKINYTDKTQRLPGNIKRLKLSNVFRDPSFLREVLSYEIAGCYLPTPRANFAKVYVNDTYLGLYNSTESVDETFFKNHLGEGEGSGILFKCDPVWKAQSVADCPDSPKPTLTYLGRDTTCYLNAYEIKSKTGWQELIHLIDTLNNEPAAIEQILDVDQVLWMLAFNNVLVNLDSYTGRLVHNYYLYQDQDGIFHPVIWDLNMSLGGFRFDGTDRALSNEKLQTLSPFIHFKNGNKDRPLISQLLKNSLYRKVYLAHIRTILQEQFSNGHYQKRASEIQTLIDEEVKKDTNKLYNYESFQQNLTTTAMAKTAKIIGITELMEGRVAYLEKHPVFSIPPPTISEVTHQIEEAGIFITAKITNNQNKKGTTEPAYLIYKNETSKGWQKMEMYDDGSHKDYVKGDLIYAATIENLPNTIYYIVAEGERTAALSPEKASHEFYRVGETTTGN